MKTILYLGAMLLIMSGCKQTGTNPSEASMNNENVEKSTTQTVDKKTEDTSKYLITQQGVGIFKLGEKIPAQTDGYTLKKTVEKVFEEGSELEIPIILVSENGTEMLKIEMVYDYNTDSYSDKIGFITILSDKFKTDKKIGIQSTIADFKTAYPDASAWFTYVSNKFVMESKQLKDVQFLLSNEDYTKGQVIFDSDMTPINLSDFKKEAKIQSILMVGGQ